jgi:DNA-binding NtrC family response regulator
MDILLIDDEPELRETLAEALEAAGHAVTQLEDGGAAAAALAGATFDVLLCDVRLPEVDGLTLVRKARAVAPLMDCILMTAFGEISDAIAALKAGAVDYLTKPFDLDDLLHHMARIDATRALRRELADARRAISTQGLTTRLVGSSAPLQRVRARIEMIAPSDAPTVVTGESGTGKELVARMLHERSARAAKPFVAVNCAAFPETLIEAELFGFERGAFTGAVAKREGRFRAADGGTLFLDEIAELPLPAQAKLLRVLQDGTVDPIGSDEGVKVDVRVVSATHRRLREHVARGLFREDLYYRINVLEIELPPLRERDGDLALLVEFFLGGHAPGGDARRPALTDDAYAALSAYPFPGNVRELAHAIEHAVVLAGAGPITIDHLPASILDGAALVPLASLAPGLPDARPVAEPDPALVLPLAEATREFEKRHLRRALAATGGKKVKAAQRLGISRKCLWEKLRRYELEDAAPPSGHARTANAE